MKTFRNAIQQFHLKIDSGINFSLSKYADGEWAVIKNKHIDNKEFWFNPENEQDQLKRQALIESFQYKNPNYFVGISCPCCQGIETFKEMRDFSNQEEKNLTWANVWVNSNYPYFVHNIIPIFSDRTVVLFCNEKSDISQLPFVPYLVFPLKNNAWEHNWNLVEKSKLVLSNKKNLIVLFCCGPFGNILCHQLTEHNPNNTYLDIGSTLNPYLGSAGFERHYYMGNNFFSNMICRWGD